VRLDTARLDGNLRRFGAAGRVTNRDEPAKIYQRRIMRLLKEVRVGG
jgi:hypothetical protein